MERVRSDRLPRQLSLMMARANSALAAPGSGHAAQGLPQVPQHHRASEVRPPEFEAEPQALQGLFAIRCHAHPSPLLHQATVRGAAWTRSRGTVGPLLPLAPGSRCQFAPTRRVPSPRQRPSSRTESSPRRGSEPFPAGRKRSAIRQRICRVGENVPQDPQGAGLPAYQRSRSSPATLRTSAPWRRRCPIVGMPDISLARHPAETARLHLPGAQVPGLTSRPADGLE